MTPTETTAILRQFNEWRRGEDEDIPQPAAHKITTAIDAAVKMIDRLEAVEKDAKEQARLNGMGGERELALMARVEAAERKVGMLERLLDAKRKDHAVIQEQNSILRAEIDNIKEVQFDLKVKAVAAGWSRKCEHLEKERDALRAKIERMKGQEDNPAPSVPDDVVEQAVNRFLSWKLPKDFHPDGGMVFIPTKGRGYDSPHWPVGTNLLNAQQTREMLRYVFGAAPEAKP